MTSRKLLNEWYGYDRDIVVPDTAYKAAYLYLDSASVYSQYSRINISDKFAEMVRTEIPDDKRVGAVKLYYPASDGYTDEDYLKWITENHVAKVHKDNYYSDWREISLAKEIYGVEPKELPQVIRQFFQAWVKRTDKVFRIIEINEFIHRGKTGQTFEDFLNTDTEYQNKCKILYIHDYSSKTQSILGYNAPEFLSFGPKVALKTRKLLLPLTHEDFLKVIDYESNPFHGTNKTNSNSYDYLKLFIEAALGKVTKIGIEELDPNEIENRVIIELMSGSKTDWSNISIRTPMMSVLAIELISEISKINYNHPNFKRNFSHLLSTGVISNLTPMQLCAVVSGYENIKRWAEDSKGKSTLEIVTNLIIEEKLDPAFFCKIMSHIIVNDLQPIVVDPEFDWHSLEELPIDWAFESSPRSIKKRSTGTPRLVAILL